MVAGREQGGKKIALAFIFLGLAPGSFAQLIKSLPVPHQRPAHAGQSPSGCEAPWLSQASAPPTPRHPKKSIASFLFENH
jgi:hypothetical protein